MKSKYVPQLGDWVVLHSNIEAMIWSAELEAVSYRLAGPVRKASTAEILKAIKEYNVGICKILNHYGIEELYEKTEKQLQQARKTIKRLKIRLRSK